MRSFLDRFVGNLSPSALLVSICFWSWCDLVPFSPLLPQAALCNPYPWVPIASLLFAALGLGAFSLVDRLRAPSLHPGFYVGAALVTGSLGSIAIYAGYLANLPPLLAAGSVLTGLYQASGATIAGCVTVCQGKTNALIHIAACLPFNVIFVLMGMFLQPGAAVVLCTALPLLSALCFKVFLVRGTNDQTLATVEKPSPSSAPKHARYGGYIALLLLITAAFGFMEAQDVPFTRDAFGVAFLDYASLLIRGACALAVFCAYVFYSRQPHTFLVIAIALMGSGLLVAGTASALGALAIVAASLLVITGYAIFDLLIWAILVIVHRGSALSMRRFLCGAYALDNLGIFLGMALATFIASTEWLGFTAALLGGALLITAFVVLGRPHSVRDNLSGSLSIELPTSASDATLPTPAVPAPHNARSGVGAQALGSRYFLTDREQGVLELLLAGRSAPYIAEQLCVSQNTVKTHVRHIYAKLDIHTRQELLDLVQEQGT